MKYHWKVLTMLLAVGLIMASCTKKNSSSTNVNSNVSQHNEDVSNSTTESNNVNTDVNTALTQTSIFGKNFSAQSSLYICGATIDSSGLDSVQPFIVITYTGSSSCSSTEIRSGQIRVQLISGSHWVDAGAVVQLTFINYKVVYPYLNNHSLTFNGIKYLTDVNGVDELQYYLTGAATALLRERSYNMLVTFDNGQTSSWNSARHTNWTVSSYTTFTGTVYGDTTINGLSNIDSWGKTRFNTNFTTQMIQPWQSGTTCGWWQPTQGNYTSVTDSFTVSALLGVNSAGNQVSSGCAWGLKLTWTLDGYNGTALVQYW